MKSPKISIIMPICAGTPFLAETVRCIRKQTFLDFEWICISEGSHEEARALLTKELPEDDRLVFLEHNHGPRSWGLEYSRADYVLFLNSDDRPAPQFLEKLYEAITLHQADIASCNYMCFTPNGERIEPEQRRWRPSRPLTFDCGSCPDHGLRILPPVLSNRLYSRLFLREQEIVTEERDSCGSLAFAAVTLAAAKKVACIPGYLTRVFERRDDLKAFGKAVAETLARLQSLPGAENMQQDIALLGVDSFLFKLKHSVADFSEAEAESLYRQAHECFREEPFQALHEKQFQSGIQYRDFCTVRKQDYETMKRLISRRLVISLTTYPARIHLVSQVLDSIYSQTRKADEIVLWLAEEQFPEKEKQLPHELLQLAAENRLTIRWCDDLKPHKKYFYAFQEYSEDLVITIDDDLLYPQDMLACLFASYLMYPNAVSTLRTHLLLVDENNRVASYKNWIKETDQCIYTPSMQLLACSGSGVLHPPELYRKETFDKEAIQKTCIWQDDLWLKTMQLISDIPAVLAKPHEPLRYVPDSQDEGLYVYNVRNNQNDVQWNQISDWLDETMEPGILVKKMTVNPPGKSFLGVCDVSEFVNAERQSGRIKVRRLNKQLADASDSLTRMEQEKKEWEKIQKESEKTLKAWEQKFRNQSKELEQLRKELAAERRSFRLLRKFRNGFRLVREKGLGYTVKLAGKKVLRKIRK